MYPFLAALSGALIAVMILLNGNLTTATDPYTAAVVIHAVGLVGLVPILAASRARPRLVKGLRWYHYMGGAVGVLTTVFQNYTIPAIGVSATLALGLLGQIILSLLVQQRGWFHTPRQPFKAQKLLVLAVIAAGIALMQPGCDMPGAGGWLALMLLLAFLSGCTIVLNRLMNAFLGERAGVYQSTLFNYAVGLVGAALLLAVLERPAPLPLPQGFGGIAMYLGGLLGIAVVLISNIVTTRIPSLQLTLYIFTAQLCAGLLLDWLFYGEFSPGKAGGALCVLAGLLYNQYLERANSPPVK